jgi:hypothetical protein
VVDRAPPINSPTCQDVIYPLAPQSKTERCNARSCGKVDTTNEPKDAWFIRL